MVLIIHIMTRKKRLLLIVVVIAVFVVFIISLISRGGQATACQELIYGMEDGDVEGTYAMLSDPAQQHVPIEEWGGQVDFVQQMYAGREEPPELIDTTEETPAATGDKATIETYRVVTDFGPWEAKCVFYESSGGQIGSFSTDIGV